MTTFTPQRGDYFEVKDLTEEQFFKIRKVYKDKVDNWSAWFVMKGYKYVGWKTSNIFGGGSSYSDFSQHPRRLTYQDVFPDPFPNMRFTKNGIGWDLPEGHVFHGDFIQPLPRPEEDKMIDWNKAIETDESCEAVCIKHENENVVVAYKRPGGSWEISSGHKGSFDFIRNKPELIKPQGWFAFTERNQVSWSANKPDALRTHVKHVIVSAEELMSGKFKDGIPLDTLNN